MKRIWLVAALALVACGDRPETELVGRWDVQQIAGASLGEGVDAWIEFDANGEGVRGFTGCNAFIGTVASFQTSLTFSPLEEEATPCPSDAAATDEARLLGVLPSVQRYIRHGRSLELLSAAPGSEALVRLRLTDDVQP